MKSCCCGGEIGYLLCFVSKTRGRVPRCVALKWAYMHFLSSPQRDWGTWRRRGKLYDKKKKVAATCGRRMFGLGERRQGEADVFFEFPSRARVRRFSFFSFTSSPVGHNAQYIRA